jgi:hypothetical protein
MTESEYYAADITDTDLDAQADAGDYLNQEACVEADGCDDDDECYVPTLREVLDEQRRAAGKPPFCASIQ